MRASTIALRALGAAGLASAMQFNSPAANSTIARGTSQHEVTWSTVETDPSSFSIYLVNFVNWPPFYQQLAANVETASGATTVRIPCDLDVSGGYQLNAINGTNVYIIYAQTPKFSIGGESCEDPAPAETSCAAAPAVTVTATFTVTVSPPPKSSSVAHRSNNGTVVPESPSSSMGVTAAAAVSASTTALAARVTHATCPDTIGWGPSGYTSPVTLTEVPRAPSSPSPTPGVGGGAYAVINALGAGPGAAAPSHSTSVEYQTVGTMVYKTVYRDLSEYTGDGSCNC